MHASGKITVCPTRILAMPQCGSGELSDKVVRMCDFCGKDEEITPLNKRNLEALSGPKGFYCRFCLQNGLNTKSNRNVLVMSFRAIFGYYYHEYYANPQTARKRMSYSQILDYVESHERAGLVNPVFRYDGDTFLWFVDFNRVGNSKRRLKSEEVNKTVLNVLSCFNLANNVPRVQLHSVYRKYEEAITNFYQRRYRPSDKPILIPTLSGCGPVETGKGGLFDRTRAFTRRHLQLK